MARFIWVLVSGLVFVELGFMSSEFAEESAVCGPVGRCAPLADPQEDTDRDPEDGENGHGARLASYRMIRKIVVRCTPNIRPSSDCVASPAS